MTKIKPIYGTSESGTETILSKWLNGSKDSAIKFLMMCISVNKPETPNNTEQMAKDTIEKWIEDNYETNILGKYLAERLTKKAEQYEQNRKYLELGISTDTTDKGWRLDKMRNLLIEIICIKSMLKDLR